jgi:molybdopterin-guanine dinucleotide biosynthesis protein A
MGVTDKTALVIGGRPLLDHVLAAAAGARHLVVVGEPRPTAVPVHWVREDPLGGGPAAAIAAGLAAVEAPVTVLLAGDLPLLTPAVVERLVAALDDRGPPAEGAVTVDPAGREQWLCAAWRTTALRPLALAAGAALHAVFRERPIVRIPAPGDDGAWLDCDTPADLRRAADRLTGSVEP